MPLFMIILVAAVQGLTEFLPVSSSGHLALIPAITDRPYQGRAIDVAAHVGTLGAVLLFLRADLGAMLYALRPGGEVAQFSPLPPCRSSLPALSSTALILPG